VRQLKRAREHFLYTEYEYRSNTSVGKKEEGNRGKKEKGLKLKTGHFSAGGLALFSLELALESSLLVSDSDRRLGAFNHL
jgi:hypothetical protein